MVEEWEEVTSQLNIWLPDSYGQSLTGEIMEKRDGTYGPQWLIKTEAGEEFWTPSHKVLQARLNNVQIGSTVKLERIEDLPPKIRGQNPTTMYKVLVKKVIV